MDQIKTLQKISQILTQAFKEVNDVCANLLVDQSVSHNEPKHVQKKPVQQKPKQKPAPVQESQPKKEQKKETKPQASEKVNTKPAQQPKQATQPKQQTQTAKKDKESNPDKPKQPLSAFFLFQQQQKENVKKLHPNASITEVSKLMGEIWRSLQESQKAPFVAKSQALKKQYEKDLNKFYEKHPEQKSKKQLKRQKAQSKKQEQNGKAPVSNAPVSKPARKPIVIEQEDNSESV